MPYVFGLSLFTLPAFAPGSAQRPASPRRAAFAAAPAAAGERKLVAKHSLVEHSPMSSPMKSRSAHSSRSRVDHALAQALRKQRPHTSETGCGGAERLLDPGLVSVTSTPINAHQHIRSWFFSITLAVRAISLAWCGGVLVSQHQPLGGELGESRVPSSRNTASAVPLFFEVPVENAGVFDSVGEVLRRRLRVALRANSLIDAR